MLELNNLAIVPAKGKSKRLPNKNILDFCGQPLIMRSLSSVISAQQIFDEIHISTEDGAIANMVSEIPGYRPKFLRPKKLSSDTATLAEVCRYVIYRYQQLGMTFRNFCLLWPTAPLRLMEDITESYKLLDQSCDGVVGVTSYDLPVHCAQQSDDQGFLTAIFPNDLRKQSQQLPQIVCDVGSFAWVKVPAFENEGTWLPKRTKGFFIEKKRCIDIDTIDDFKCAEFLYQNQ